MDLHDAMIGARAVHFAATMLASGVVFFAVFIAADAPAAFQSRLAAIAWPALVLSVISGAAWLLLTAQSMSGQPLADVVSQGVIWTVLLQTDFGNDWLVRLVIACLLAGTFVPLLAAKRNGSRWITAAAVVLAAALVGSLAWAGHAIGGTGAEGIVHPAADVLHLIAAAAWLGSLPLLALLLAQAQHDDAAHSAARAATLRFSTLGILSVGTLVATGIVNTWYLAGSVEALVGTLYGRLLLVKIALFCGMVAIAAINKFKLTPRLVHDVPAAAALRRLRRNAAAESLIGVIIVIIVAVLGTEPPASHVHHHPAYGAIPADAAFVHIHTEEAMADVTIMPGRAGPVRATIRLWNGDFGPLDARGVTLTLTAPSGGGKPVTRVATLNSDGAWEVDGIDLSQPGNWTVVVDAVIGPTKHFTLDAPVVIDAQ
jgi:putative copper resistance protein D